MPHYDDAMLDAILLFGCTLNSRRRVPPPPAIFFRRRRLMRSSPQCHRHVTRPLCRRNTYAWRRRAHVVANRRYYVCEMPCRPCRRTLLLFPPPCFDDAHVVELMCGKRYERLLRRSARHYARREYILLIQGLRTMMTTYARWIDDAAQKVREVAAVRIISAHSGAERGIVRTRNSRIAKRDAGVAVISNFESADMRQRVMSYEADLHGRLLLMRLLR